MTVIRVLITGAAGFIGSTTAEHFHRAGHEVVGIDSVTDYYDERIKRNNIEHLTAVGITFVEADLLVVDLAVLLAGIDVIVHLAGQPGVRGSWGSQFHDYVNANVAATQRLLEAATAMPVPVRRFVYSSSSSIYGQATSYPTTETAVPKPFSPYGVTKLAGEHLTSLYRENFGLPSVSFRFFTVYGPRQRPDMAFARFFTAMRDGKALTVYGDGTQVRDFTFVGDIVDALLSAAEATGPLPGVMNLAGGSSITVLEVLDEIGRLVGREPVLEFKPAVDGDVYRTGGSADLARGVLGWVPSTGISEGLAHQFAWFSVNE